MSRNYPVHTLTFSFAGAHVNVERFKERWGAVPVAIRFAGLTAEKNAKVAALLPEGVTLTQEDGKDVVNLSASVRNVAGFSAALEALEEAGVVNRGFLAELVDSFPAPIREAVSREAYRTPSIEPVGRVNRDGSSQTP